MNETWTCPNCGAFTPYGQYHTCGGLSYQQRQYQPTYFPYYIDQAVLERIAKALEEIADRLKSAPFRPSEEQ